MWCFLFLGFFPSTTHKSRRVGIEVWVIAIFNWLLFTRLIDDVIFRRFITKCESDVRDVVGARNTGHSSGQLDVKFNAVTTSGTLFYKNTIFLTQDFKRFGFVNISQQSLNSRKTNNLKLSFKIISERCKVIWTRTGGLKVWTGHNEVQIEAGWWDDSIEHRANAPQNFIWSSYGSFKSFKLKSLWNSIIGIRIRLASRETRVDDHKLIRLSRKRRLRDD